MPCAKGDGRHDSIDKAMNSMLLPEMSGLLEPGLAVLAVLVPIGLAYLMIDLPRRSMKDRSARDETTQTSSPGRFKNRCGKLDS